MFNPRYAINIRICGMFKLLMILTIIQNILAIDQITKPILCLKLTKTLPVNDKISAIIDKIKTILYHHFLNVIMLLNTIQKYYKFNRIN